MAQNTSQSQINDQVIEKTNKFLERVNANYLSVSIGGTNFSSLDLKEIENYLRWCISKANNMPVSPETLEVRTPAPPVNSGSKYHRTIYGLKAYNDSSQTRKTSCVVDVYSVLSAFNVHSPGLQHAIKKLLCAGLRNKGSLIQDLKEVRDALDRAIEDAE